MSSATWVLIGLVEGAIIVLLPLLIIAWLNREVLFWKSPVDHGKPDSPHYMGVIDLSPLYYPECLNHSSEELSAVMKRAVDAVRYPSEGR